MTGRKVLTYAIDVPSRVVRNCDVSGQEDAHDSEEPIRLGAGCCAQCQAEGSDAESIGWIEVGIVSGELPERFGRQLGGRPVDGRPPYCVARVGIGTSSEEIPHRITLAVPSATMMKGPISEVVGGLNVGAMVQQQPEDLRRG